MSISLYRPHHLLVRIVRMATLKNQSFSVSIIFPIMIPLPSIHTFFCFCFSQMMFSSCELFFKSDLKLRHFLLPHSSFVWWWVFDQLYLVESTTEALKANLNKFFFQHLTLTDYAWDLNEWILGWQPWPFELDSRSTMIYLMYSYMLCYNLYLSVVKGSVTWVHGRQLSGCQ